MRPSPSVSMEVGPRPSSSPTVSPASSSRSILAASASPSPTSTAGAGRSRRSSSPRTSRYRFVAVIERETTAEVIAAFEAAWAFYGGIFRAVIIDNLKAVVQRADPTEPLTNPVFQEYVQERGFVIDPARPGGRRTRRASSGRCATSATTASPASASAISRPRALGPSAGAVTSTARGGTAPPAGCRASTSSASRRPPSCRR